MRKITRLTESDLVRLVKKVIRENKGGYIITGENKKNSDIHYFVNDEDGVTACNKDINKRPDDIEKEKVFVDRKSAQKFKKDLINWREDISWYIEEVR